MSTCRGLHECHNPQCSHLMQHKKINRKQFTPKSVCKSCGTLSSRSLCEAREIWEFREDSDTVIIKHCGLHSCSPIKPKLELELTKEIVRNTHKSIAVRQNILSSLVREGADLEVTEDKAEQLLDRTCLNKLRNNKTGPNEFSKLIELKQKYDKKDKFLIYSLNSRSMNSKPTYIFSGSETAIEIGRQINRDKNNYLSSTYACFDGNEKRGSEMTTLSLFLHHPLLRKQILLATMHCESENKENSETFWNLLNDALSSGLEERYMFNPAGLMLDETSSNWDAIKNVFGCEFMERRISCEFHFK